jgi:putative ABC transport system ATP-binding protein
VIFADEPTGNLDSVTGREILDLFQELHDDGNTIVIATHDQAVAAACPRHVVVHDGLVASDDDLVGRR